MSVEERMKRIISEILGLEEHEITRESRFVEDLGVESLDVVEMIAAMEEEFGIVIPEDEAQRNLTVGQAIDYIEDKLKKKA